MKVLKFGGSSVAKYEALKHISGILNDNPDPDKKYIIVCSALYGVTNGLLESAQLAFKNQDYLGLIKKLEVQHYNLISDIIPRSHQNPLLMLVKTHFNEIEYLLSGIKVLNELSLRVTDYLISFGERLSAPIINAYINCIGFDSEFIDSRDLIKTNSKYGSAEVKKSATAENIQKWYRDFKKDIAVVTGFIASDEFGDTTTLGRGGSDYTASIFGAELGASSIEIWTDVDGFMTADPKLVKKAYSMDELSYQEAMEMTYFGAKVIYPPTMIPAIENKIPIIIKNTYNPDHPGTVIHEKTTKGKGLIKGIVSLKDVILINISGNGLIGLRGFDARLFSVLYRADINIMFITQASSEHSISFVIAPEDKSKALEAIQAEFHKEILLRKMETPYVEEELSILSVVGENMKSTTGISGRFFSALGKNGINIVAIAQGSTELNISAVISKHELSKALNVVHDSLLLSPVKTFNVFCAGTGNIGTELFEQIKNEQNKLSEDHQIHINMVGISNSRKMILAEKSFIKLDNWKYEMDNHGKTANLIDFIETVERMNLPNTVFIDNTSSEIVVDQYESLFNKNISVVTCNKIANSGSFERYIRLKRLAKKNNVSFLYETNVGAGLPIIKTLQDLLISGDRVLKIEAILSGTISYIFNNYVGDRAFAEVVKEAQELGFTEPDPRDDLNGMDFSRKMLILAREIGLPLEMSDVKVEDFLPAACLNAATVEDFYEELKKHEDHFATHKNNAEESGKKLRLIGILENGKINVEVKAVGPDHPFYGLSGSDNIISFTTSRYAHTPLVVKGPGAGAPVTAAGVFADLIRVTAV